MRSQVLSPSSFGAVDNPMHSLDQDPDVDDLGIGNEDFQSAAEAYIVNTRLMVSVCIFLKYIYIETRSKTNFLF